MRTLVVVLMMAGAAWAQSDADERAQRRADYLKNRLELTDEQTDAAKKAYAKEEEGRKKLEDERSAAIKEALNDDQKTQYDELRNRSNRGGRRGGAQAQGGRGGFGGGFGQFNAGAMADRLKEQLSLSDDQLAKIKPILEESGAKVRKRFEDMRANGFQGVDWRAIMGEVRADMEKASEQVKAHLNEEQKSQYDEIVGQPPFARHRRLK